MADWNKLNERFDSVIDRFTEADWQNWLANRQKNRDMRRTEMLLKAFIQSQKMKTMNERSMSFASEQYTTATDFGTLASKIDYLASESNYAMAA